MKPILVPNPKDPKDPHYICRKQLADLDARIEKAWTKVTLCEGVKYGRWATIEFGSPEFCSTITENEAKGLAQDICYEGHPEDDNFKHLPEYYPDAIRHVKVFGRWQLIFMWLPFFD